jgi:Flp pilus assembly protein TadG
MMSRQTPISKITAIRQAIRNFMVGEDGIAGSALIEFTLCAPLLVIASIYTMDFGLEFYKQMKVQNAAQAGVDWTIANRIFNSSYISTAATNATNDATISVSTPIWQCGCPSSTGVTPTGSYDPATATCTTPCGSSKVGLYVTVQTQAAYNPLVRYGLFSSGPRTLTAQATARIQ